MRFRASIQNITTFTKFTASLATLGHIVSTACCHEDSQFIYF